MPKRCRPVSDADPDEEDIGLPHDDCYMAATYWGGKLGIAFFQGQTAQLSVLQSAEDCTGPFAYQTLQLAKVQARPQIIYASSRSDSNFLDHLRRSLKHDQTGQQPFDVRIEKAGLFSPEQAFRALQRLSVRGLPHHSVGQDSAAFLHSLIDTSGLQQVAAAGALVAILHKEGLLGSSSAQGPAPEGQDGATGPLHALHGSIEAATESQSMLGCSGSFEVEELQQVTLNGCLTVDAASMQALQIFKEERHPSGMGIGTSKEGFSVFGMLNRCVSPMGRKLLRSWFLRPVVNLQVLTARQDAIEGLMQLPDMMKSAKDLLKKTKDLTEVLRNLSQRQGLRDPKDFQVLQHGCSNLLMLRELFQSILQDLPQPACSNSTSATEDAEASAGLPTLALQLLGCIGDEVMTCHTMVADVLDMGQSDEGMLVAYGVCRELDEMKNTYNSLPDYLTQVCEAELQRVPPALEGFLKGQFWSVMYMPQVGFLLRIEGNRLCAALEDCLPDFEEAFASSGPEIEGTYYRTSRTQQLDAYFGDMLNKIQDLESSICTELVRRLMQLRPHLHRAVAVAAEVDCLLALAATARECNHVRPQLVRENVLHIRDGRHLLAEMVVDTFIPNDTHMTHEAGRVQVITGPNWSGKSCYAKQVAVIVFLAHVGAFVPAAEAVVGMTDRIFTRIATQESVNIPQSSFMVDLSQLVAMQRLSTGRSLCIIDEFGKGTLTADGVGLLCATLSAFAERPDPPRVVACTHFSEVLKHQYLPRSPQIAFHTMSVLTGHSNDPASGQGIVFLHKLVDGYAAPSFGLHCASMAGVEQGVLQRAAQVIDMQTHGKAVCRLKGQEQAERDIRVASLVDTLRDLDMNNDAALKHYVERALTQQK